MPFILEKTEKIEVFGPSCQENVEVFEPAPQNQPGFFDAGGEVCVTREGVKVLTATADFGAAFGDFAGTGVNTNFYVATLWDLWVAEPTSYDAEGNINYIIPSSENGMLTPSERNSPSTGTGNGSGSGPNAYNPTPEQQQAIANISNMNVLNSTITSGTKEQAKTTQAVVNYVNSIGIEGSYNESSGQYETTYASGIMVT